MSEIAMLVKTIIADHQEKTFISHARIEVIAEVEDARTIVACGRPHRAVVRLMCMEHRIEQLHVLFALEALTGH